MVEISKRIICECYYCGTMWQATLLKEDKEREINCPKCGKYYTKIRNITHNCKREDEDPHS